MGRQWLIDKFRFSLNINSPTLYYYHSRYPEGEQRTNKFINFSHYEILKNQHQLFKIFKKTTKSFHLLFWISKALIHLIKFPRSKSFSFYYYTPTALTKIRKAFPIWQSCQSIWMIPRLNKEDIHAIYFYSNCPFGVFLETWKHIFLFFGIYILFLFSDILFC